MAAPTFVEGPFIGGGGTPISYASITVAVDDMVLATSGLNGPGTPTLTKVSGTATVASHVGVIDEDGAAANQASIAYLRVTGAGTLVVGQNAAQTTAANLWIITGVDWSSPIGVTASLAETTNQISPGLTTNRDDSLLVVAANDWSAAGTPTSTAYDDSVAGTHGIDFSYFFGLLDTTTIGPYSGLIDGPGTAGLGWSWVAAEVHSPPAVPGTPTGVTGEAGHARVRVAFTPGSGTATSYDIDWATAAASTTWLGPTNFASGADYVISGLTIDTSYVFRVRGNNVTGSSAYSTSSAGVTPEDHTGYLALPNGTDRLLLPNGSDFLLLPAGAPSGGDPSVIPHSFFFS